VLTGIRLVAAAENLDGMHALKLLPSLTYGDDPLVAPLQLHFIEQST